MHPKLFEFDPFGLTIPIYSYGVMIMLGAITAYIYIAYHAKKELGIEAVKVQALVRLIIFTAFVGGKLLFYFENPSCYFSSIDHLISKFKNRICLLWIAFIRRSFCNLVFQEE